MHVARKQDGDWAGPVCRGPLVAFRSSEDHLAAEALPPAAVDVLPDVDAARASRGGAHVPVRPASGRVMGSGASRTVGSLPAAP